MMSTSTRSNSSRLSTRPICSRHWRTSFSRSSEAIFLEELVTLWEGGRRFQGEVAFRTLKGRRLDVIFTVAYEGERCEQTLVSIVDISARKAAEEEARRLAAIVANTDDAVVSIDLTGAIVSWNHGAETLYGYPPADVLGKPITMIIPPDRREEEHRILERIRAGERIDHYETVRHRKDGTLVDVSLTVSPVIDSAGGVIGASKIARDITERRRAQEQQRLLLREMKHRITNTLATVQGIATQTLHGASREEHAAFQARLRALADAHDLLTRENWERSPAARRGGGGVTAVCGWPIGPLCNRRTRRLHRRQQVPASDHGAARVGDQCRQVRRALEWAWPRAS